MTRAQPLRLDLASPAFKANPYPFYARLRAGAPVFPVTFPDRQTICLEALPVAFDQGT